ncbi:hypothetical protein I5S62_16760 [Pseudomonas putida]|uniref:hypothetical protein n=1 Tax=Pseudomonas TaxID=286 RepID=UPI0018D5F989|nr:MULTISPECIES: hypothetical protein [Pseudomonas]MBH3390764.1 hypothetical protein [Pseudomonas putida]
MPHRPPCHAPLLDPCLDQQLPQKLGGAYRSARRGDGDAVRLPRYRWKQQGS